MTAETDHRQPEPVLARVIVLLHQTALLERGEQAGRSRLVQAQATSELRDPCLPVRFPQRNQQRGGTIHRPYSVAIQHDPTPPGLIEMGRAIA